MVVSPILDIKETFMEVGAFTVSLAVKDIQKSYEFYTKLGFVQRSGDLQQKWVVLQNGNAVIGLFQGMFEKNMLTFVPGWNQNGKELESFTDIRDVQRELLKQGIELQSKADETTKGPAYFTLEDPDGNPILFDQYR
jgi:catechol 2,3-dioxygenase-like lactoylglutathione lyase family enzyme